MEVIFPTKLIGFVYCYSLFIAGQHTQVPIPVHLKMLLNSFCVMDLMLLKQMLFDLEIRVLLIQVDPSVVDPS